MDETRISVLRRIMGSEITELNYNRAQEDLSKWMQTEDVLEVLVNLLSAWILAKRGHGSGYDENTRLIISLQFGILIGLLKDRGDQEKRELESLWRD